MMPTFLPYRCPTFRTDHLLEPCTKNLARIKYLKLAKKHIGPLERCVECKGERLITVPLPNKSLEEGRLSTEKEGMLIHPVIPVVKPYRQDWNPNPEVTTAPLFLNDVEVEVTRKPNWPEMRQLSPEAIAAGRKAGHNLGKKYKKNGGIGPKQEKIVPELPEKEEIFPELPEKAPFKVDTSGQAQKIVQVKPEVLEQRILEGKVPPAAEMIERFRTTAFDRLPEVPIGARFCPAHPEVLQRVDKLNRWMGMCAECLSDRGRRCGLKNAERGVSAPPMSIPLNMPKYAELKEWLVAHADKNERSMTQQIMMILKTAWRDWREGI